MDLDSHERYNGDVQDWVDEETQALKAAGVVIVECTDFIQEHSSCVILPTEGFRDFIKATAQPLVFLYRGDCDVSARIKSMIEDVCEEGEDPALMVRAFETQHALLVKRAKAVCATHFYAELNVLHQGGFVLAGVLAQAYEDLLAALQAFCESAEDRRAEAKEEKILQDEETLEVLADELMKDPAFSAIRGKRKRCVYVSDKYGLRVPRHHRGELRRVDQTCDPMDSNLVSLVERVSDRLELLK
ncbi:MAG: hypothetical protein RSP_04960 [Rhodanobacter sp.]